MFTTKKEFMDYFTSKTLKSQFADMAEYNEPSKYGIIGTFNSHFELNGKMFVMYDILCGKLLEFYLDKYLLSAKGRKKYNYYVTFIPHGEKDAINHASCYLTFYIHKKERDWT